MSGITLHQWIYGILGLWIMAWIVSELKVKGTVVLAGVGTVIALVSLGLRSGWHMDGDTADGLAYFGLIALACLIYWAVKPVKTQGRK